MKTRNNKNITQKIIIAIVIVLSFNFITPTFSQADFGGVLLGPVIDLIAGIGDSVMALLQVFMDGGENSLLSSSGFLVESGKFKGHEADYDMTEESGLESKTINASELDHGWFGWGTYSIPIIKYSPEKIFANEVPALDANFINPKEGIDKNKNGIIEDGEKWSADQEKKSIAIQLRETISSWYNALRNLVIVGMLSILLYVGIRMMITSTSSDKAKYKQMLMDWIIALCLLFFLHYIMSFTMTVVGVITDGIRSGTDINVVINDPDVSGGNITFKTNLTGLCRMQVQYADLGTRMVYLIFYIALVVYTFMFTWKYMKRAITMAFLTLMAPLVTLTYPIDKMGDGKAQAFNMWLKEYIFNALLQPFHLIIYTIFLGASMDIAIENPLYAILFLAFIVPAEKLLRKFFKFDQTNTAGASFAGALGGAAAFNAMKGAVNKGAKLAQASSGGKSGSGGSGNIRQQRQLTDPNAPDGRVDPFLVGAGAGAAAANNNDEDNNDTDNTPPRQRGELSTEGDRIRGEQQAINDLRTDDLSDDERAYLDEEERRLRESDQRGVVDWARDSWNSSDLKHNLDDKRAAVATFVRTKGEPVRRLAARARDGAGAAIGKAGEIYRKAPKPIRNSIERTGKAGIRTIKGAVGVAKTALPAAGKFAGRAAVAGTFAAVGLGMGIAGDDLEDTFKYAGAGAALGWATGPALGNGIAGGISASGGAVRNSFEAGAYGREEAALRQQDREFVNDQDNRDFFEERVTEQTGSRPSRGELNQTMEVAAEYNRAGITDLKQINKSMLLEQELTRELQSSTTMTEKEATRSARDQAMTIAKIAQGVDAKDLRDKNKVQQLQDSFARELKSKDPSISDQVADAQASRIVAMVKKQKKVY